MTASADGDAFGIGGAAVERGAFGVVQLTARLERGGTARELFERWRR